MKAEVDVEAVGEHQHLALGHVGGRRRCCKVGLDVSRQDHDLPSAAFRGVGNGHDFEAGASAFFPGLGAS